MLTHTKLWLGSEMPSIKFKKQLLQICIWRNWLHFNLFRVLKHLKKKACLKIPFQLSLIRSTCLIQMQYEKQSKKYFPFQIILSKNNYGAFSWNHFRLVNLICHFNFLLSWEEHKHNISWLLNDFCNEYLMVGTF